MSWGKKIAFAYGSFVVFMVGLVYLCIIQKDIFLVTPDYYKEELAYETKIQQMKNVATLEHSVNAEYAGAGVLLDFPSESKGATGTVRFYRPSNANLDISIPLNLDAEANQDLNTSKLRKGAWVLKLDWTKAGTDYYQEIDIVL